MVLVVEDDRQLRRSTSHMLRRNGFRVLEAADGSEALHQARRHPKEIDLAVVDMVMPGMSGLDVAAEFERSYPRIRVLYVSGYVTSIAIQVIAERSPDSVLLKPFTEQVLIRRVRRLLGIPTEAVPVPEAPPGLVAVQWKRLMEASDRITHPYRIVSYGRTSAACSIAAVHAAVLRGVGMEYSFRRDADALHPFELLVDAEKWQRARDAIALAGLGVDIAVAA